MSLMSWIKSAFDRVRHGARIGVARLWERSYGIKAGLTRWQIKRGSFILVAFLLLAVSASLYWSSILQRLLETLLPTDSSLDALRNVILTVGGALIGASAIVTSLVLFAMQVNVERLPYGLFRKLNADKRLITAFAFAFLLATLVVVMSMPISSISLAVATLIAFWCFVSILGLFLYTYQRALILISPNRQLGILIRDALRNFRSWARRAQHARPFFESHDGDDAMPGLEQTNSDLPLTAFFKVHANWTEVAEQGIRHAMSFARRYAEQGDYEISGIAHTTVYAINAAYIDAKGRTFFANDAPLIPNPLANDPFINNTLEHLRMSLQSAISRNDERQITQTLRSMANLVSLYLQIEYPYSYSGKEHANLATMYLAEGIQEVIPQNLPEVLMEGQRLLGAAALLFLANEDSFNVPIVAEKITLIARVGCIKENYHPVLMEGIRQLSNITFELLVAKTHNTRYIIGELHKNVTTTASLFLIVPDNSITSIHSSFLDPYFSFTDSGSFKSRINQLIGSICAMEEGNDDTKYIIANIELWARNIHRMAKELLLDSIKYKSKFTFDIVSWIFDVTSMLLALSNAPACDEQSHEELESHALSLIKMLSWIPMDSKTVNFVENYQLTDGLFGAALDAHSIGKGKIAQQGYDMLLKWTFEGGKAPNSWGILERGLCGLAVLTLVMKERDEIGLVASVRARLSDEAAPDQQLRDRAARELTKIADNPYEISHRLSRIDRGMTDVAHQKLAPVLREIASLLSTDIAEKGETNKND